MLCFLFLLEYAIMDELNNYTSDILELIISYAPSLVMAIAVLIIGFWLVNRINLFVTKALGKMSFSPEIVSFLGSLVSVALKVMVIFTVAEIVGIETTSFVAVLAAAGFAVGLALQGSLGNFAAGIIILVFKPYRVGDWVSIQDKFGKVTEIQIFNTIVDTPGQNRLIIPNGQVIGDIVTNFSAKGFVRLELDISMPYSESFPKVQKVILNALKPIPKILSDPEIEIGITNFDSHNIIVSVRPYCQPDDFWDVKFASYAAIKKAFHDEGIEVAYSEGVELGRIGD